MSKRRWWCWTVLVTIMFSILVSGCRLILEEEKDIDYKSATKPTPLDVPPDLISPTADERYTIPDGGSGTTFSSYNNERGSQSSTSSLLPMSVQDVHIARAGTQRWLVVPQPPEAVWPVVKEFWQELGFLIKLEIPEAGILETDWAENRAKIPQDFIRNILSTFLDSFYSTAERDKFRTRLERTEMGTTEIYISHRGMDETLESGGANRTIWQPRRSDPDLEAEMLARLMIRFGVEEERARFELAAANGNTPERAYIDSKAGDVLIINEAFDRSWRRVGLALDRIGFTVEDRDRIEGLYFVRYVNPETDSYKKGTDDGILSNIMFWKSKDDDSRASKYRIRVKETGTSTSMVTLLNEDNTPVSQAIAKSILTLLHEQLK